LLLAQRTADNTTADARREAEKTLATARAEAETALAGAKQEALRVVETARADARRAGENERVQVEEELQQLLARLEFLRDDVAQLDRFTSEQRTRLREAAEALNDIAERPVGGLGEHRSPVLSAASDMPPPFGTPVTEVATPVSSATGASGTGGAERWGDEPGLPNGSEGDSATGGNDPEAATQALDAVDQAEIDDLEQPNRTESHEITAEVPVTPPAQGSGMRVIGGDDR
jgi:hypothetical protein